jgi:hypothetical protein
MLHELSVLNENPIENVATVAVTCWSCGTAFMVEVDYEGFLRWRYEGTLLQLALPQNTHDERELLLTGTCGKCYDEMFDLDDEEKED